MSQKIKSKKIKEIKNKARSITITLIENMLDTMEDLGRLSLDRKEVYQCFNQNRKYEWRDSQSVRWLHNLKQRELIKIEKSNNSESIVLTNKAKMKLIEKIVAKQKPDNCYRFITFDIPNKMTYQRNQFRSAIKKMGFVSIQKSLWVIDRDVTDLIEMISYEYGVENYIAYIISAKSDIDGLIEKKLNRRGEENNMGKTRK